jgi:hypothetical protein
MKSPSKITHEIDPINFDGAKPPFFKRTLAWILSPEVGFLFAGANGILGINAAVRGDIFWMVISLAIAVFCYTMAKSKLILTISTVVDQFAYNIAVGNIGVTVVDKNSGKVTGTAGYTEEELHARKIHNPAAGE